MIVRDGDGRKRNIKNNINYNVSMVQAVCLSVLQHGYAINKKRIRI